MENDLFNSSLPLADQNPIIMDASTSHIFPGTFVPPDQLDLNSQRPIITGYSLFSTLRADPMHDLDVANHGSMGNDESSISENVRFSRHSTIRTSVGSSIANADLREHFMGAALPATSITNLFATSNSLPENISSLPTFVSNNGCKTSDSHLPTSLNCAYNGSWDDIQFLAPRKHSHVNYEEMFGHQVFNEKTPMNAVSSSYHVIGSSQPSLVSDKSNVTNPPFNYCIPSNELSLSLATCKPSVIDMPIIPDQCSEISGSDVTQVTSKERRYADSAELPICSHVLPHSFHDVGLRSEQTSANSKGLSLSCSHGPMELSHVILGSKFLHAAQSILAEIAIYTIENQQNLQGSFNGSGSGAKAFSSSFSSERGVLMMDSDELPFSSGEIMSQGCLKLMLQREELERNKAELHAMLQVIDRRYKECLDQIQTIISAFHVATDSDPQMHARFAIQTISVFYKNLRERITNQILLAGESLSGDFVREKEKSFESSFIEKQWALQQLRRNDPQSWRPQRGLPEKAVSVLRAWMFQNFLHPYPKDAEKHVLAMKSGLTRNQVSNWFINARVRLWKPMIEEMYKEINRKG